MDFNFKTFSTRSFERFTQALALHVLGNGVLVYGDGPDGAREATYDGKVAYPNAVEHWSGYIVMQAKFLQVPGTPQEDANWLVTQLRAELNKYSSKNASIRKPEYYIIVSNAKLSPLPEAGDRAGGIAKIDNVFDEYKEALGLKGYSVWHHDQICTFLQTATDLRRSYAAWLSSSDVIADLLAKINERSANVQASMFRYLSRELRAHQPIRLQQAGHAGNSQTMIEDVFVDLPFESSQHKNDTESSDQLLLAYLLDRSRDKFDASSTTKKQVSAQPLKQRVLIFGGPGQGKSTLSQFLAQIFRANLLYATKETLASEISKIASNTLGRAVEQGLPIDVPKRFPFRIDLPAFADWLNSPSDEVRTSLLTYIAAHINKITSSDINPDEVRRWISDSSTILILDGLDEVPPSSNRAEVIRKINEFWDEAAQADLFMIVTTRPQGYNEELDPTYYSKCEMTALNEEQALAYAGKLIGTLISDPFHADRVSKSISEAAKSATTARLMISPLQVAILLALIDQSGDAPTDRWSLFEKYFSVMLQREQSKSGPVGVTMKHWNRQISAIHYKAGFLLQVAAEKSGQSDAHLSHIELNQLIRGQLEDEEFCGEELNRYTAELLEASRDRLVLLVQKQENNFSFEVRSLQEFFAAAHIMTGREIVVQARLESIANKEHWLHVFQIAASKCFSINDAEHYRDTIITLCNKLNDSEDHIDMLLKSGSSLALALLDDGLAYDQPRYWRLLFKCSIDILSAGSNLLPVSLSSHCRRDPARSSEFIKQYLSHVDKEAVLATWALLIYCDNQKQLWVEDIVEKYWPTDASMICGIATIGARPRPGSIIHTKLRKALELIPVHNLVSYVERIDYEDGPHTLWQLARTYPCMSLLYQPKLNDLRIHCRFADKDGGILLSTASIELNDFIRGVLEDIPDTLEWEPQRALRDFWLQPGAAKLANLLATIDEYKWQDSFVAMYDILPWPVRTAFLEAMATEDFASVENCIRSGYFGDFTDWQAAEERWTSKGISFEDFFNTTSASIIHQDIARIGLPAASLNVINASSPEAYHQNFIETFRVAIRMVEKSTGGKQVLLQNLIETVIVMAPKGELFRHEIAPELALFLLEEKHKSRERWADPRLLISFSEETLISEPILDLLNMYGQQGRVYLCSGISSAIDLSELMLLSSRYPGLLVFIANIALGEEAFDRLQELSKNRLAKLSNSESIVIQKYAFLVEQLLRPVPKPDFQMVLKESNSNSITLPTLFLHNILTSNSLDTDLAILLAESAARAIFMQSGIHKEFLLSPIRRIADKRKSDLHNPETWRKMAFGESLLNLSLGRMLGKDGSTFCQR